MGLRPDSGTRRWRYDPDAPLHAVREDSAITEDDYDTAMSQLLATHDPAEPLSITVRGDHVVFYMDHGLGDGQMIINLSHTLADADARNGIVPGWATAAQTRHPLAVAAMRCFGTDPGRVAQLLRSRVRPGIGVCGRKHAGGGSAGHNGLKDITKALGLILKSNAVVLEWLTSPVVYTEDTAATDRLRTFADAVLQPSAHCC